CVPLAELAPHLFTTRQWPLGAAADGPGWDAVASGLGVGPEDVTRARQVHGTGIAIGRHPAGVLPEADILLAWEDPLALGIQVADCVPLLIVDPRSGAVAAVHAGWRGLVSGAPATAVAA